MSTRTDTDPQWKRLVAGGSGAIWVATLVLFLLSPVVAPGSLDYAAVAGMLPFASILAITAAGQTLVIQQRGLDLSVPGMLAFGAVLASGLPQWYGWPPVLAIAAAIVAPGLAGLITGLAVTRAGVMPLVATLGMNAFLLGLVFKLSSGTPAGAPPGLADFTKSKVAGVPSTLLVAAAIFALAGFTVQRSVIGRRLTAVGVSERASAAAGFRVGLYQTAAYGGAGVLYGLAAVLYTGYVSTPPLFFGDSYLLASIAAVVTWRHRPDRWPRGRRRQRHRGAVPDPARAAPAVDGPAGTHPADHPGRCAARGGVDPGEHPDDPASLRTRLSRSPDHG